MFKYITKLFKNTQAPQCDKTAVISSAVYVTIDWGGNPITTKGDGYILPRRAENILNKQYYPTGAIGEWPCDPITGEKLSIEPIKK